MTDPNPLPEFFRLLHLAAEAAEAVDAEDGVNPALTARQAVAAADLIIYCAEHGRDVKLALMWSVVHAMEATP